MRRPASCACLLLIGLWTILLSLEPAAQPEASASPYATTPELSAPETRLNLGSAYPMGGSSSLRFTLTRAQYVLGWTDHVATKSGAAGSDEKMLTIFFTVENAGRDELRFRDSTLEFLAIDEQGLVHERSAPMEIRTARFTAAAAAADHKFSETLLRPGEPLALYTAILVPKRLRITRLLVRDNNAELTFPLTGVIETLPSAFQDGHPEVVREEFEVGAGQFLPGPSFDIRIDGSEVTDDPARVGRKSAPGSERWALIRMTVRNRAERDQVFSQGSFRETRIVDTAGEWHEPRLILRATAPEKNRPRIEPTQTGEFILAFRLPEESVPKHLRLQVTGTDGNLSHRFIVGLGGGPTLGADAGAPVAAGVLYVGAYALQAEAPLTSVLPAIQADEPEPGPPPVPWNWGETVPGYNDSGEESTASGDTSMQDLPRATITLSSIEGWSVTENDGDEPYLAVWSFRGQLRPGGYGTGVVVLESRMVTLGNNGFLSVARVPYAPNSDQFRQWFPYTFENVKPYEFYGIVVTLAEADSSSHDSRRGFGQRLGTAMDTVIRTHVNGAPAVDTDDATEATQSSYLSRLSQMADAMRGVNVSNLFSATAGNSSLNSDDYLATRVYIGAHLPALARGGNSATVMRSPATWSELIEAGSNMGLPVPYELLWHHSIP
ncbi:hypothetical protein [Haliea sp.]|uniref:hypothetical protein n=2 Tax=Haliea TaxID=475794 RepID=UPI000C3713C2|nr:hypothetical protein [Haliea sp.]MAY93893.1 hypothetical protein [Haliea sp.]